MKYAVTQLMEAITIGDRRLPWSVLSVSEHPDDTSVTIDYWTRYHEQADRIASRLNNGESYASVYESVANIDEVWATISTRTRYTAQTTIQNILLQAVVQTLYDGERTTDLADISYPAEDQVEEIKVAARLLKDRRPIHVEHQIRILVEKNGEYSELPF